jgi:hypothetical protein
MVKQPVKKLQLMAAACLLSIAAVSAPVYAHHKHRVIVPVLAGFAFGAIAFHGHGHHRHHGHHGHGGHGYHGHGHGNHGHQPRHSHSHGGYQ